MTLNVELLEKTMTHILDHPETHNQRSWISVCGTTACFAGWACQLAGLEFVLGFVLDGGVQSRRLFCATPGRWYGQHPADIAEELLGITHGQACRLFRGSSTVEDLQHIVKDLVNSASKVVE